MALVVNDWAGHECALLVLDDVDKYLTTWDDEIQKFLRSLCECVRLVHING